MWSTSLQLQMLLLKTAKVMNHNGIYTSLPDTLWVLLAQFSPIAGSMFTDSMVLGPQLSHNHNKHFWLLPGYNSPVRTHKAYIDELVYIAFPRGFQITWSVATHHLSVHQLTWYYRLQQVSSTVWTALVTWYMHFK